MARIENFEDLVVWQQSMDLAERVYRETEGFPVSEMYGLRSQIRRCAVSVPANIAEGFSRRSRGSYRSHVSIALGSNAELRTHLELARRLGFLNDHVSAELYELVVIVGRLLHGLWRALFAQTVCYSVGLAVLLIGLWPWALGLIHASARLS